MRRIRVLVAAWLILVAVSIMGCSLTIDDIKTVVGTIVTNHPPAAVTNSPTPPADPVVTGPTTAGPRVVIPNWGGRPAVRLMPDGTLLVVVDSNGGPDLATLEITAPGAVSPVIVIRHALTNPQTKNLFSPSVTYTANGVRLCSAWCFTFEVDQGCLPYYWTRKSATENWTPHCLRTTIPPWKWEPCKIESSGTQNYAFWFGYANHYYKIDTTTADPSVSYAGQLVAGSNGGGEKEARYVDSNAFYVANSGCKRNGGSYFRIVGVTSPIIWSDYAAYSTMGSDDGPGHPAITADLGNPKTVYLAACYKGLVVNVYDGKQLLFPVTALKLVDKDGHSGAYKYAVSMVPRVGGGAWIVYTASGTIRLARIMPDGTASVRPPLCGGFAAAIAADPTGKSLHIIYNDGKNIMYRKEVAE